MFKEFINWGETVSCDSSTRVSLHIGEECDNRSAYIDFDKDEVIGRITCWDSGDYHSEIILIETERVLFSKSGSVKNESFDICFKDFFSVLQRH
jgi:hypothetical protein